MRTLAIKQTQKEIEDNKAKNHKEADERRIELCSSPSRIFIQLANMCNSDCIFCSRDSNYEIFNLDTYIDRFQDSLFPYIKCAEELILTGSGEFLQLPKAEEILKFFDESFPYTRKSFSTNGSSLRPHICDYITQSASDYTIHVSLHASNAKLHNQLTRMDNFHMILGQLDYMIQQRSYKKKPEIVFYFVATRVNISDLPNFISLAHKMGADRVASSYNFIYKKEQEKLSCFFEQEKTNRILDEAESLASALGLPLDLPPSFGLNNYNKLQMCMEPWTQTMVDMQGNMLPCDAFGTYNESLTDKNFFDIWNGKQYKNIRTMLAQNSFACSDFCIRANPASVNIFKSHVISRGKDDKEADTA